MVDLPINIPEIILGDNMTVVNDKFIPDPNLSKINLGVYYHAVRGESAAGIWKL